MAKSNQIQGPSYLDPMFEIPEGLVNYQHSTVPTGSATDYVTDEEIESDLADTEVSDEVDIAVQIDPEEVPNLDIPNEFTIVEQVIRTLPSGMQVVDVIIEVEDVPGAINYDFRVVKM